MRRNAVLNGLVILAAAAFVITGNGCGGGGGAVEPPPTDPSGGRFIVIENGRVKTEENNGKLVIKADESQLPGMVFSQDAVQVELYLGDGFANPRTDTPPPSSLISTFQVSRDGTLLDDLELEESRYTVVATNIEARQGQKRFRSNLIAFVFDVYKVNGVFQTTLPEAFEARFPAIGYAIEGSYVRFRSHLSAVGGQCLFFMERANGTVTMTKQFEFWPPSPASSTHANVSFESLPGGPELEPVQRIVVKAFKP